MSDPVPLAVARQRAVSAHFRTLLRVLRPALVCDVGALNGAESVQFRADLPHSTLLAFEANPRNFAAAPAAQLAAVGISWEFLAIGDRDGTAEFHVLAYDGDGYDWRAGASSLRVRPEGVSAPVTVGIRRLDTVLRGRGLLGMATALWIDVEGAADLVLAGAVETLATTLFLKIEVERIRYWQGQSLDTEVLATLDAAGFVELHSSRVDGVDQYDVLLVRRDILDALG